ncbi:MAG: iron chaperone [Bacteroidota bacterium]
MQTKNDQASSVDMYILNFPKDVQLRLEQVRATILKAAPKAEEGISYQIPAYTYKGKLAYFAGYKNHIGFYPTPDVLKEFKNEISVYKNAKGSVQFPHNEKLPLSLVTKMVKFRIKLNEATLKLKATKKSK